MKTDNIFYDKDFRSKVLNADKESLSELMANASGNAQVKVLTNTKDKTYYVIPDIATLDKTGLFDIQAAGKVGTAGSVGSVFCAGTLTSICGTFTSAFSLGTLGTTGTANPA